MRQIDQQLGMTKDNLDKQKTLQMCNEMLEFLTQDDVVYSIRETGTGTNIHVELDLCTGENPTFTIFKTYPIRKRNANNYLKLPQNSEERKCLVTGNTRTSNSTDTLERSNKKDLICPTNTLIKSSSMDTVHNGWKKLQLKKTFSTETIDCGQLESLKQNDNIRNKVSRAATITGGQKVVKRDSFASSKESIVSLDNIEEQEELFIKNLSVSYYQKETNEGQISW